MVEDSISIFKEGKKGHFCCNAHFYLKKNYLRLKKNMKKLEEESSNLKMTFKANQE